MTTFSLSDAGVLLDSCTGDTDAASRRVRTAEGKPMFTLTFDPAKHRDPSAPFCPRDAVPVGLLRSSRVVCFCDECIRADMKRLGLHASIIHDVVREP